MSKTKTTKPTTTPGTKKADAAALAATEKARKAAIAEIDARLDEKKAPSLTQQLEGTPIAEGNKRSWDKALPKGGKGTKPAKPGKTAKAPKASKAEPAKVPKQPKAERTMSALDAAAAVLATAKEPMGCQLLIAEMAKRGLWKSPGGATPDATLNAAIHREIKTLGKDARFSKAGRGLFVATGVKN